MIIRTNYRTSNHMIGGMRTDAPDEHAIVYPIIEKRINR